MCTGTLRANTLLVAGHTGGTLDEGDALEERRLEGVRLALVHVAHRLQVHRLVNHLLPQDGVQVLVLLRSTQVRDGVVARLVIGAHSETASATLEGDEAEEEEEEEVASVYRYTLRMIERSG